ncbi:MAG TPA: LysR substrate-binding domain-containing protein [Dongiaceae bacterium]|jgi:molybdate transport repressor ModE-like protein
MQPYLWTDLELRHLLALQAIAEAGSFWAAAERLGCSQSALSQQVSTMEKLLDVRLVERSRGRRTVSMTEAGALLLKHAEVIAARVRAVHADLTAFAEGSAGILRVGTFESSSTRLLPPLLRQFRARWPKVDVRLTELAKDDQLLQLIERGELDLSFAILPLPNGPFQAEVLLHDPYVLVVAADARPRLRKPIRIKDIQSLPLLSFPAGRSVEQVEAYLRSRGINLNVIFRSNYNGTVQGLAAVGEGAALAPRLTIEERREDTKVLGEVEDLPPRVIALAWHKDRYRSPAAKAFAETAVQVSRGYARRAGVRR